MTLNIAYHCRNSLRKYTGNEKEEWKHEIQNMKNQLYLLSRIKLQTVIHDIFMFIKVKINLLPDTKQLIETSCTDKHVDTKQIPIFRSNHKRISGPNQTSCSQGYSMRKINQTNRLKWIVFGPRFEFIMANQLDDSRIFEKRTWENKSVGLHCATYQQRAIN